MAFYGAEGSQQPRKTSAAKFGPGDITCLAESAAAAMAKLADVIHGAAIGLLRFKGHAIEMWAWFAKQQIKGDGPGAQAMRGMIDTGAQIETEKVGLGIAGLMAQGSAGDRLKKQFRPSPRRSLRLTRMTWYRPLSSKRQWNSSGSINSGFNSRTRQKTQPSQRRWYEHSGRQGSLRPAADATLSDSYARTYERVFQVVTDGRDGPKAVELADDGTRLMII